MKVHPADAASPEMLRAIAAGVEAGGISQDTAARHLRAAADEIEMRDRLMPAELQPMKHSEADKPAPKDWGRAKVGVDGNHGFALLGEDLQVGEAEFVPIEGWPNATHKQERAAWRRALSALEERLGSGPLRYEVIS